MPHTLMYLSDHEPRAVRLDLERRRLSWFQAVGSTCGDDGSSADQDAEDFVRHGPPAQVGALPGDTARELRALILAGTAP